MSKLKVSMFIFVMLSAVGAIFLDEPYKIVSALFFLWSLVAYIGVCFFYHAIFRPDSTSAAQRERLAAERETGTKF
jgi:predicted membrane channel-forming protein YqfA (hemolysin III family)